MKAIYTKPALRAFGDIEKITQTVGQEPTQDFLFFNGNVVNPNSPDDGNYSYFCGSDGCAPGPTP